MARSRPVWVPVGLVLLSLLALAVPFDASADSLGMETPLTPTVNQQKQKPKDNGGLTVYATRTGARYHKAGCSSLRKSSIPMKLRDAVAAGLTPCGNCKPPGISASTSS